MSGPQPADQLSLPWILERVAEVMARYYPTEQPAADTVPTAFLEKAA